MKKTKKKVEPRGLVNIKFWHRKIFNLQYEGKSKKKLKPKKRKMKKNVTKGLSK